MSKTLPPPPIMQNDEPDPLLERVQEVKPYLSPEVVSNIVLNGDLSKLSAQDLTSYYIYRCRQLGLDPASKPFDIMTLQGKKIMYANKGCAAQLRDLRKISTGIIEEKEWNGLLLVKVRAWFQDGRQHEDEGFARLEGLSGDALGNARLKAMTKATRRAILHLCGLGENDESEVETIPGAQKSSFTEAKALLVPKTPATGSDAIRIIDIRAVDETTNTVEVLDKNDQVWHFWGKENVDVALKAVGKEVDVLVDYTLENGKYIVRTARL